MTKKEATSIANIVGNMQFADTLKIANIQRCVFLKFSRQEYWSGVPFPTPGDLPNPGLNFS